MDFVNLNLFTKLKSLSTATTTRSRLLEALLHEALEPAALGMEAVP